MTMILKRALLILAIIYGIYFVGVAAVLNTPLFAKLTEMDDEELTHVRFGGAFSFFPGFLWASHGKVVIKDQNVAITIQLSGVSARFDLLPLKQKRLEITSLKVKETQVDLGMKTLEQTLAYAEKYTKTTDVNREARKQKVEAFRKTHLTLQFKKIVIDHLNEITSSLGKFKGELSLDGGFEIQPGVQVEVYPTRLMFHSGELPGQFSKVSGQADVHFDRFQIMEAPGNAVFPFFNAKLALDLDLQSLQLIDLTLRSIEGYRLTGGPSHLKVRVETQKGELQQGSFIGTEPSRIDIQSDSLVASGNGKIEWKVDRPHSSTMQTHLTKIKLTDPQRTTWSGSLQSAKINLTLFENNMVHAFQGNALDMRIEGLKWKVQSDEETKKNLRYQGLLTGKGTLYGLSGVVPDSERKKWEAKQTDFRLRLEKVKVQSTFLPEVTVGGTIRASAKPINLTTRTLQVPKIDAEFKFTVGKFGESTAKLQFTHAEYLMAPAEKWKGQIDLFLDQTSPFIDAFRERDQISAVLGTAGRVRNLKSKIDWEMGKAYSWFRVSEIHSDGVWKAYGSLANDPKGMSGAFETSVLGVPVGIRVQPDKTEVKAFPGTEWYDRSLE
jgi:hypothetical protein